MPSRILYDKRNNAILRSQPHPIGSAGPATLESLCRSARVSMDEYEHMDYIDTAEELLTREAQKDFVLTEKDEELAVSRRPTEAKKVTTRQKNALELMQEKIIELEARLETLEKTKDVIG